MVLCGTAAHPAYDQKEQACPSSTLDTVHLFVALEPCTSGGQRRSHTGMATVIRNEWQAQESNLELPMGRKGRAPLLVETRPEKRQTLLRFGDGDPVFVASPRTLQRVRQQRNEELRSPERARLLPVRTSCVPKATHVFHETDGARWSLGQYVPSGVQKTVVCSILGALRRGSTDLRLEAPTGSGKTLAVLGALLSHQCAAAQAGAAAPRVLWFGRTHEEILHARRELEKLPYQPLATLRLSRQQTCVLPCVKKAEDMRAACEEVTTLPFRKPGARGCRFLERAEGASFPQKHFAEFLCGGKYGSGDIEAIVPDLARRGFCPYHALADLSALGVGLVLGTYQHLVDPLVRFVGGFEPLLKGAVVVFDEAHNIEETAMDSASLKLENEMLRRNGDQMRADGGALDDVSSLLYNLSIAAQTATSAQQVIEGLRTNEPAILLARLVRELRQQRQAEIRLGRASPAVRGEAYNYAEGVLLRLGAVTRHPRAFVLVREAEGAAELVCVDCNGPFGEALRDASMVLMMSGTLPRLRKLLAVHPDGQATCAVRHADSFYDARVLVRRLDALEGGVRLDSRRAHRPVGYCRTLAHFLHRLMSCVPVPGGALVFAPSYADLGEIGAAVEEGALPVGWAMCREDDSKGETLARLSRLCETHQSVLCLAVARGRLAEGADLRGRLCCLVVVC